MHCDHQDSIGVEPLVEFWQIKPILNSVSTQVQVDAILDRLGLHAGLENVPPETSLDLTTYFRIQRELARSLNDLTLHLSSRKLIYETGSFVVEQMKRATTLKDALISLCDYFNMMHGDTYNSVRQKPDSLSLVVDDSNFPYTLKHDEIFTKFVGDCVLIKVHCLLDSLSNGIAMKALRRVTLCRSRSDPGGSQNAFWSVPVVYNKPAYELVYDFDLACTPIRPPGDMDLTTEGIFARVISHLEDLRPSIDARSFQARTRELVEDGLLSQEEVAMRLGLSVATLRRRLAEEGISFRGLVHQVRFEVAKSMLSGGQSVNQVSEKLDYSDIRAFNRAFKKWTGQTPAEYARSARNP